MKLLFKFKLLDTIGNYTKRGIAFIILVSHMLTSCWNGLAPKNEIIIREQEICQQQSDSPKDLLNDNMPALASTSIVSKEKLIDTQNTYLEETKILTQKDQSLVHGLKASTVDKGHNLSASIPISISIFSPYIPIAQETTNQVVNNPRKVEKTPINNSIKLHLEQANIQTKQALIFHKNITIEGEPNSPVFIARGGHQVRFTDLNCTQAIIDENVPPPFSRKFSLRVKKQNPNLKLADLVNQTTAWQQNHIDIYFPEKDPQGKGCIYIGHNNWGLSGGGKEGEEKEKFSKEEKNHWDRWALHELTSKFKTFFPDICLKDKQAIDEAVKWYFSISLPPIYQYGPKIGSIYTQQDFVTLVEGISCYCACNKCSVSVGTSSMPSMPMSSSSYISKSFSLPTFNIPTVFDYSSLSSLGNTSSPNLVSFMSRFFSLCTLSTLQSNNSPLNFTHFPLWTVSMINNCAGPTLSSTSPSLPLYVVRSLQPSINLLLPVSPYTSLPVPTGQSGNSLIPNPTASGIRFENSSPVQQVMHSRPMQDLAGALINLGFTMSSYSKQVAEYHDAHAKAKMASLDAKVEESMRRLKESSYQAAIENAQQEEKERQKEAMEEQEKEKLEEERLQSLIESRLAAEQAIINIVKPKRFVPASRKSNLRRISSHIKELGDDLSKTTAFQVLSQKQQEHIKYIATHIEKENKEIKEILAAIHYTKVYSEATQFFQQYKSEDLETVNKLLEDLKNYKEELRQLLAAKGKSLSDHNEEEMEEEKENYRELEEEMNDPSDTIELVVSSQRDMQGLLDHMEESDSKRKELQPKAIQVATNAAEIVEVLRSQHKATEKLYFVSEPKDYIKRSILEGVQKIQFLRAGINTLTKSLTYFCRQFVIRLPNVPSVPIVTKETLKEAFNILMDLLVPGSEFVKAVLGTRPMPQTPKQWANLAMEAGFDFIPVGKALKLVAGPAKPFLRKKIKGFIVGLLKKRGKKFKNFINQSAEAVLKNGYYEVNGFKFSEYYYEKLWQTGRKAPSLVAKEILQGAKNIIPHPKKQGFFIYEFGGWEMVYNPISKEIWHLMPN